LLISYCYGINYCYTSQSPYLNLLKWTSPNHFNRIGPLKNNIEIQSVPLPELHSINHNIHYQLFGNLNFHSSETSSQHVSGLLLLEFSNSIFFQNNFTFSSNSSNNKHYKGIVIETIDGRTGYFHSSLINYKYSNNH